MASSLGKFVQRASTPVIATQKWLEAEELVGRLPTDYKVFVDEFGAGRIDDYIVILTPDGPLPEFNLLSEFGRRIENHWRGRSAPGWFSRGEFIPFAMGGNGELLGWITIGEPESWATFVVPMDVRPVEEFGLSFSDLLEGLLSGDVTSKYFPSDWLLDHSTGTLFEYWTGPLRKTLGDAP